MRKEPASTLLRSLSGWSLGTVALLLAGCGGGAAGGGKAKLNIEVVSHGFGTLLPHRVLKANQNGSFGPQVVAIDSQEDLIANVLPGNDILPPALWPAAAILPNGEAGNHFLYAQFSQDLDPTTILGPNGFLGAVTVVAVNGLTGQITPIKGRAFVGGQTYGSSGELETWLALDGNGVPRALDLNTSAPVAITGPVDGQDAPGWGFPGTQSSSLNGLSQLLSPRTLVFVPDQDTNLATHQTFPTDVQVRMRITTDVQSVSGKFLQSQGLASSTVGSDPVRPEVSLSPTSEMIVQPSMGETDVDPLTSIHVSFTEPIQPQTLSTLEGQGVPTVQSAIQIQFGPESALVTVPYSVEYPSVYDLTDVVLKPAFNFPGQGPADLECGTFNRVTVTVFSNQFRDLTGNTNALGANSFFFTGEGPGLINAPVAPDTIYIARIGSTPSISVIDLNGFGGGTGNPTYDVLNPVTEGNSNYPNNPNVQQGSLLIPQLQPGTCTFNGGSSGVFSLAKDSSLSDKLVTPPIIESVSDMALGHALDTSFNNGPPPFGCQAGGGNPCAFSGYKVIQASNFANSNTLQPTTTVGIGAGSNPGGENIVSWAPHPNPPPLTFPPPCLSPFIAGQEPTSVDTSTAGGLTTGIQNLLNPGGFPLGNPLTGAPPSTLLVKEQNTWFIGPSPASAAAGNACQGFSARQQIGQYFYVLDRVRREVVVLNSNRMTVLDRITLPDPTSMAVSPNLELLAVTNQSGGVVSFIDISPTSSTFHQVVKETDVGLSPRGIAWQPENEDILVCNEGESSLSVISAFSLEVRKVATNQLNSPFEVAITPRQSGFGFNRNVYFAYILNRDGTISIFESGPDGVNGWGFDDIILQTQYTFQNPKTLQPDHINLSSGVWIIHEGELDVDGNPTGVQGGAVSNLVLTSGFNGQVALGAGGFNDPNARDMEWSVQTSIGPDQLTGIPVDIAFDNQMNQTGLPNYSTNFSAGSAAALNGKGLVRGTTIVGFGGANSNEPAYMFLAVPNSTQGGGVIDVINMGTSYTRTDTNVFEAGIQSIPATGAQLVMDYFRQ